MTPKPLARISSAIIQELLFDERPIEIGKFRLGSRSAKPIGKPSIEGWSTALEFACSTHEASPYWIGDLMAYSESREDWNNKLDQMKEISGLAEQTLKNLGYISRHVEEPERRLAPTIGHSDVVASLERPDQAYWLEAARTNGWTVRDLRVNVRASKRRLIIEGQATLEGQYRVITADPPWLYNDSGPTVDGSLGKAEGKYPGMTIEELCKLPVKEHALENSILFCWVTAPMLYENPGPREVIEAWGFTPKTGRVWDKVLGMHGHYASHTKHEHLIIATRGSCLPDVPTPEADSVFVERRSSVHSEKPASVYQWIEQHWTIGPYLELFGVKPRAGWRVFGNDARLWAQQAEEQADAERISA